MARDEEVSELGLSVADVSTNLVMLTGKHVASRCTATKVARIQLSAPYTGKRHRLVGLPGEIGLETG